MVRKLFFCFILYLFLGGCGKKNVKSFEGTTYRLALLELNEYGYCEQGYKRALAVIEKNSAADSSDALVLGLKATCLFRLGKLLAAQICFEQARKACKNSCLLAELDNNYACVLAALCRFAEAQVLWNGLLASKDYLTPEVALVNSGKMQVAQGLYSKALESFTKALAHAPQFVDAYYYRALVYDRIGEFGRSKDDAERVLVMEPGHAGALQLFKRR